MLEEAIGLTDGPRADDYGSAYEGAVGWAAIMRAATGLELEPKDYALSMIAAKLVRQRHKPKRDNLVDIAGYARVAEMIEDGV